MTKLIKFAAVAVTAFCLPAIAMAATTEEVDTNSDGMLTLEEIQAAYPDFTAGHFAAADANSDEMLDPEELRAAAKAGVMMAAPIDH